MVAGWRKPLGRALRLLGSRDYERDFVDRPIVADELEVRDEENGVDVGQIVAPKYSSASRSGAKRESA